MSSTSVARPRAAAAIAAAVMVLSMTGCTSKHLDAALPGGTGTSTPPVTDGQPVSLPIHCGIKYAQFDGDTWEALPPVPSIPSTTTDASVIGGNRYSIAGMMSRTSGDQAEFVTTDDPANVHIRFQLSHATIPGCA